MEEGVDKVAVKICTSWEQIALVREEQKQRENGGKALTAHCYKIQAPATLLLVLEAKEGNLETSVVRA